MIKIVNGNLLDATENIIGHQVNCMGRMGAGVANQIRGFYPEVFERYKSLCEETESSKDLLGKCQFVAIGEPDENKYVRKYIANLFSQWRYGNKHDVVYTDYDALKKALIRLKRVAEDHYFSVALPYGLGCGLANGKWEVVYAIIDEVFSSHEVTLYKLG